MLVMMIMGRMLVSQSTDHFGESVVTDQVSGKL